MAAKEIMQAATALNQAWEALQDAQDRRDSLQADIDLKQTDLTAAKAKVLELKAVWDTALANLKAIA